MWGAKVRDITSDRLRQEMVSHPKYKEYQEWKHQNQNVYDEFRARALQIVEKKQKFGIWLLESVVRWFCVFERGENFSLNNNVKSLLVRDLMIEIPEMRNLCRTRNV